MSESDAPESIHVGTVDSSGHFEPAPLRYSDEKPWHTLHPEVAEGMLRRLYAEARPLFAYFHREAMMGDVAERKPNRWEAQGSPDRQGGNR